MAHQVAVVIRDDAGRQRFIRKLADAVLVRDGKRWPLVITVERLSRKRSLAQNRLYWMWLKMLCEHIHASSGELFSDDELHEWCKAKFLPTRLVEVKGISARVAKSTAKLKTMEFAQYLTEIDGYACNSLDFVLPRPEDLYGVAMGAAT